MIHQRYYAPDETPTELERLCTAAMIQTLHACGWEFDPDDNRQIVNQDGTERRWFSFGFEDLPDVEPALGTIVTAQAEGSLRTGPVYFRGPGFFGFRFKYKSGGESTANVFASSGTYRVAGSVAS